MSVPAASTSITMPPGVDPTKLLREESLARHTSMRVGGPADLFCEVDDDEQLAAWVVWARERGMPVFLLGGGTNLVVGDGGIRGLTIKLGRPFMQADWSVEDEHAHVVVGAGFNFKKFVLETLDRGFAGLEFAEGIPGTIGGGVIMNAGAFGGEIGEVVEALRGVDIEGRTCRLGRDELHFSYRHLDLPRGFVVTALELKLHRGDREAMAARAADARAKRGKRQPLGYPNAGSIWKNPPGDFAGRLIDTVGMRGERVGGAQISPQHGNFIVNVEQARAADVGALMERMRDRVWEARGVWLQAEVKLVGDWSAP